MVLGKTATRHHLIPRSLVEKRSPNAKLVADVLAAADRAQPKLRRDMLNALNALETALPNLEALIASGSTAAIATALTELTLPTELSLAITEATLNAAIQVATPEAASFNIAFNQVNDRAVRWAEANAAKLLTQISPNTPATQVAVKRIVVDGLERGLHPSVTSRQIKDVIGLLPNHQAALNRQWFSMLEQGINEEHAAKVVGRRATKLRRYRATMIARTETINAANMGQQLVWETALDLGLLPEGTKKVWVATFDDRLCKICAVLDGTTIEIRSSFAVNYEATGFKVSGDKITVTGVRPMKNPSTEKAPTAHPQCRCGMVLVPL